MSTSRKTQSHQKLQTAKQRSQAQKAAAAATEAAAAEATAASETTAASAAEAAATSAANAAKKPAAETAAKTSAKPAASKQPPKKAAKSASKAEGRETGKPAPKPALKAAAKPETKPAAPKPTAKPAAKPVTKVQGAAVTASLPPAAKTAKSAKQPPSDVLIRNFAVIAVETIAGIRSLSQIRSFVTMAAYQSLRTQLELACRARPAQPSPADRSTSTVTGRVFSTRLNDNIYEAVVTVQQQHRAVINPAIAAQQSSALQSAIPSAALPEGAATARGKKPPDQAKPLTDTGTGTGTGTSAQTSATAPTDTATPTGTLLGLRNIAVVLRLERIRGGWRASELYVL